MRLKLYCWSKFEILVISILGFIRIFYFDVTVMTYVILSKNNVKTGFCSIFPNRHNFRKWPNPFRYHIGNALILSYKWTSIHEWMWFASHLLQFGRSVTCSSKHTGGSWDLECMARTCILQTGLKCIFYRPEPNNIKNHNVLPKVISRSNLKFVG